MNPFLTVLISLVQAPSLPVPTAEQLAWHDLELGLFVHLAPQTWQNSESDLMTTDPKDMDPAGLDTDAWVEVAQQMDARYVVFVAKHEGGFCWWQTDTTDHGVKSTPWRNGRGDLLAELALSCRDAGLKLGIYVSPQDRKHGAGIGGKTADPAKQAEYEALYRTQLTEVLSRYGEISEVWFDGSLVFDVGDILAEHAPRAVVFQSPRASIRWAGNEDGLAPDPAWNAVKFGHKPWGTYTADDGDPKGDRWLPIECDARLRDTWFWRSDNEHTLKTLERLMDIYVRSVGHGAVLLLNVTPDTTGRIPTADARLAGQFGARLRKTFGRAAAETSGRGMELTLALPAPTKIGHVMAEEDLREGERVRSYLVEGRTASGWKEIARGTAIGHKKIDPVTPIEVSEVRWRCLASVGPPLVRRLSVYAVPAP